MKEFTMLFWKHRDYWVQSASANFSHELRDPNAMYLDNFHFKGELTLIGIDEEYKNNAFALWKDEERKFIYKGTLKMLNTAIVTGRLKNNKVKGTFYFITGGIGWHNELTVKEWAS